ncbi:AAA family ATPase [Rubellimicrobium rubrum]|nr:AAA family ATPase [Rubellimicrobium rubrum]
MALNIADSSRRMDSEAPDHNTREATLDLGQIAAAVRRQRWIFVAWVLLGLVAGIAHLATTPKSYQASAVLLLTGQTNTNIDEVTLVDGESVSEITIENALQVLQSQRLALRVVDQLDLTQDERYLSERQSQLALMTGQIKNVIRSLLSPLTGGEAPAATPEVVVTPEMEQERLREGVADRLQQRVRIYRIGQSSALTIIFETQSPELSADLANAYVQGYTEDIVEANQAVNEQTATWLSLRIAELGDEAREALTAVERFRVQNGLVESAEGLISSDSVRRVNDEYAVALADEARGRALVAAYESVLAMGPEALKDRGTRVLIPNNDEPVSILQQEFDQFLARRDEVLENFGAENPELVRLEAQIDDLASRLYNETQQAAARARGSLDVASERVTALRETLAKLVEANAVAGQALIELRALEQRAEAVSNLYEALLIQAERANQQRTLPVSNVRVLSLATVPLDPSSPSTVRTLGLGMILGLMAAALHTGLREQRERFVRTGSDVTERLGQRFLGYLPAVGGLPGPRRRRVVGPETILLESEALPPQPVRLPDVDLPVLRWPQSQFTETLRSIRLASDLALPGEGARIIGVTSLNPGEGKTTVAMNLAAVLAAGGQRTLLIDADLRKADLSLRLGLTGRSGLTSIATNQVPVEHAMTEMGSTGVDVIGSEGPNLGSLAYDVLSSPSLERMLAEARNTFRFIVLDLAPLGPVIDARLCLNFVDQVVMVAAWGQTPRKAISYNLAHDPLVRSRLLGIVLNLVDLKALPRYSATDMQPAYSAYYQEAAGTRG